MQNRTAEPAARSREAVDLKSKVNDVLNEARILALGTQVLLGFQYQALFYPRFDRLSSLGQWANLVALGLGLLALCLVLAPAPYHRIAQEGEDTQHVQAFTSRMVSVALPVLAAMMTLNIGFLTYPTLSASLATALALGIGLTAMVLWVFVGMFHKRPSAPSEKARSKTALSEKIRTLLTEARVILPGVQALLGFQLAAMLSDRFEKLPESSRFVHIASLLLMAVAVILLIAPAAYHRIAAEGDAREDVDRFSAFVVMGSLAPLALGLAGDLYVVAAYEFSAPGPAIALSVLALLVFAGFWIGYPLMARNGRFG